MIARLRKIRMGVFFVICCTAYLLIIGKLAFIQLIHHDFFTSLGNRQYLITLTKTPDRALIFDRYGQPLALNHTVMSAFITPRSLTQPKETIRFLKEQFPDAAAKKHWLSMLSCSSLFVPMVLSVALYSMMVVLAGIPRIHSLLIKPSCAIISLIIGMQLGLESDLHNQRRSVSISALS